MSEIKAGDIVELKSGNSPDMTVGRITDGVARCYWFTDYDDVQICSSEIDVAALEPASSQAK